mmetsp:Transcript_21921/g.21205  ORF Transcript_21921/g.21205 Transcript_21921/m.21205 type:complete len:403 (-) Transcript_21921:39-1247(-)
MFKKISKHTKRKGTNSQKVLFSIEVLSLSNLLPALLNIGHDVMLSVCFERGGKMCCSTDIPFDTSSTGKGNLFIKQTLSLIATLYQEASGGFQEKSAKLIIRQLKTSRILGEVYKGLGVVSLQLNELMKDLLIETSLQKSFPIEMLNGHKSIINVKISSRIITNNDDTDLESIMSDSSEMSTMGANFDPADFPTVPSEGTASHTEEFPIGKLSLINSPPHIKNKLKSDTRTLRNETIYEDIEEHQGEKNEEAKLKPEKRLSLMGLESLRYINNGANNEERGSTSSSHSHDSSSSSNSPDNAFKSQNIILKTFSQIDAKDNNIDYAEDSVNYERKTSDFNDSDIGKNKNQNFIVKTFSHTEFKDVDVGYTDNNTNYEKNIKRNYEYEKKNQTLSAVDAGGIYI